MTASGAMTQQTFNPLSPDGAYALDLSETKERVIALQLCELDRCESVNIVW